MRAYKVLRTKRYFEYGGDIVNRDFFIIFPEIKVKIPLSQRDLHDITSNENSGKVSFFNNARRFDKTDSDFDRLNDLSIEEWVRYMGGKQGILDRGWGYVCEPFDVEDMITNGLVRKLETDEQVRPDDSRLKILFLESLPS